MCYSCANGGPQIAAWLVRISSPGQKELSPESQIAAIPWLEAQGYVVPRQYILNIIWASQELLDCPEISERLIPWIKNREIHAIGMLHSDRLACSEGTAGYLYEMCQKNGVRPLAQIAPFVEGDMGAFMAVLAGHSKRKTVEENRPRIKKGLADRARLHGLPCNGKAPYGYRMRKEVRQVGPTSVAVPVAFEPDPATYVITANIFRMALDGKSTRGICSWLVKQTIKAPRGGDAWGTNTIQQMLKNPFYTGEYYALRHEHTEPKTRAKPGKTYGKTSVHLRDRSEWHKLEFPIESPLITVEEHEAIKDRLQHNKERSQHHGQRFYLLRGMVYCGEDGRRLAGRGAAQRADYYYVCSKRYHTDVGIPQCPTPMQYGPTVENYVWQRIYSLLSDPVAWWAEIEYQKQGYGDRESILRGIRGDERKLQDVDRKETDLLAMKLAGEASEVPYQQMMARLRAERTFYQENIERLEAQLQTLQEGEQMIAGLEELRELIIGRLDSATPEDKRWLLENLHTRVTVREGENPLIQLGVPKRIKEAVEGVHGDHNSQV